MQTESKKLNGAKVGVPTRNMQFSLPTDIPRYFAYNGSVVGTALMAVFSAIFPPGERFFVESVRYFKDNVKDETLKARISGFVGQEMMHTREHERLNEWFSSQGFDMAIPEKLIEMSLAACKNFSPTQQVAATSFMEHFTANLAAEWLTNMEFRNSVNPQMLKLWTWHGIEELEHKDVAFDVHQLMSSSEHLERILSVPIVVACLLPSIVFAWGYIVAREGKFFDIGRNLSDLWALFKPGGFLANVIAKMPLFLAKNFHPNNEDSSALLAKYQKDYLDAEGALKNEFKNRDAVIRAAS